MTRHRLAFAAGFALVHCTHTSPSPSPPPAEPPHTVVSPTADAGATAAEPASPTVSEADARAVVTRWLDAQNHGDFAAYEPLYAARFTGVRRSGAVTRSLNRAGWMHERQQMFTAAQQVEAQGIAVTTGGGDAVVHLTQTYTSGSYHDQGPKVLVLIPEGGGVRIAREELLRSDVAAGGSPPPPLPAGLMLTLPEAPDYVVLAEEPDEALAHGAPSIVQRDGPSVTSRAVDPARLPAPLASLIGRSVRLYGPAGVVCTGTLQSPAIVHRVQVHFGMGQRWDGTFETPHTRPLSNATVAGQAWDDADSGSMLTATVSPDAGACTGARWAQLADLPVLPVFTSAPADAATAALALRAFRGTHPWHELQTAYAADPGAHHGANWDQHTAGQPIVQTWRTPGSPRTFVTVDAVSAVGGCADFSGQLWGLYEIVHGAAVRLTGADDTLYLSPAAAVDLDGDGIPEILGDPGLVRRVGTVHRRVESLTYPNHDCTC